MANKEIPISSAFLMELLLRTPNRVSDHTTISLLLYPKRKSIK